MFERFTDRARRVVVLAQEEARMCDRPAIGVEHIALGILHEHESLGYQVLNFYCMGLEMMRNDEAKLDTGHGASHGHLPFTPECKKALEYSLREALQFGHAYIGVEHVLLGLIREGSVEKVMRAPLADIRSKVVHLMAETSSEPKPVATETGKYLYKPTVDGHQPDRCPRPYDAPIGAVWMCDCGAIYTATGWQAWGAKIEDNTVDQRIARLRQHTATKEPA